MTNHSPRKTEPRRWRTLAAVGAAAGLSVALPLPSAAFPLRGPAPLMGTANPASGQGAKLWLAQADGGEAGEAGAVAGAAPEIAVLARLEIVEGHLRGAVELYRRGMADEGIAVAYHPEAEMMEEVRADLASIGAQDISPAIEAVALAMQDGKPQAEVDAAMAALSTAVAEASATAKADGRVQMNALTILLRATAAEYGEAIVDGKLADLPPYVTAYGFVLTARDRAAELATAPDAKLAAAGVKALAALQEADALFADIASANPLPGDPAVLLGIAARVELAASQVR